MPGGVGFGYLSGEKYTAPGVFCLMSLWKRENGCRQDECDWVYKTGTGV